MFDTVKELHIAVENGLQHITANRKQSIQPEFIDLALNMSILKYIDTSIIPEKNITGKGFEYDQVAYDELSPIRIQASLPVYYNASEGYYSILPSDYKNHGSSIVQIQFNRFTLERNTSNQSRIVYVVPFNDQVWNSAVSQYYTHFNLKVGDINIIYNANGVGHPDAKFIIVNETLQQAKALYKEIEVYWQRYGNLFKPNSFIVVTKEEKEVSLNIGDARSSNIVPIVVTYDEISNIPNREVPAKIVKTTAKSETQGNYFYKTNAHRQLVMTIINNKLLIHSNDTFIPVRVDMEYIMIPTLINYKTGITSELRVNDKIINLAVQYLKALIKDEGYQHIVNENKTL